MELIMFLDILLKLLLPIYLIYFISTILHEWNHIRYAKKYGITIFHKRSEVVAAGQSKELSKFSIFLFGFEFKLLSATTHVKNGQIEKLNLKKQKDILLAGIRSDLFFALVLIIVLIANQFNQLYSEQFTFNQEPPVTASL